MNRISRPVVGLLGIALLAGSVAAAPPAAAFGSHLECAGATGVNWFMCDLSANPSGVISNQRWTRDGVAFTVGNNRSSVKFLCNGTSSVAIGVYYTEDGVINSETTDFTCPS